MRRRTSDRGANLVEFAILAPLLIMLLFGIIEFAWVFAQNLDIRHGAREGGRLAATDDIATGAEVADICSRMDIANSSNTTVEITRTGSNIGDDITVTISAPADTLTGIMDWAIPSTLVLSTSAVVRQEQAPNWFEVSPGVTC
jgi:Flp pilus assembly protein TadG